MSVSDGSHQWVFRSPVPYPLMYTGINSLIKSYNPSNLSLGQENIKMPTLTHKPIHAHSGQKETNNFERIYQEKHLLENIRRENYIYLFFFLSQEKHISENIRRGKWFVFICVFLSKEFARSFLRVAQSYKKEIFLYMQMTQMAWTMIWNE